MGYDTASKGSKKRTSKAAEDYDSDGGFVANDNDDDSAPKSKRAKTTIAKGKDAVASKKDKDNENEFWEISDKRRVTIDSFKGNIMVNLREYYEDRNTGNMMPGKKGISLPLAQYSTLLTLLPEIEVALAAKGEKVPRPDYSGEKAAVEADAGDDGEGGAKKEGKQNFEATSDEEE
ncbi:MAG: hypothetical protein Q9225_007086 [Loekoesia sp. 1 TL-2023]